MTKGLTHLAKGLRKRSTDVERLLWSRLRAGRFEGMKFRRQHPIGEYITDFVCLERKLIIELDGGQHVLPDELQKDRQRDDWLEKEGYTVARFWDNEVLTNTLGVLEAIRERLHRTPSPQSPPLTNGRCLKQGRGSNYPHKMRKNHKSLMRLFLFFFLTGCMVSCSSKNRLAGYIYYRLSAAPSTLDPALIVDVTGGSISAKLFNGLVRLDDRLKIIPDIAETWRISSDGLVYEFKLRTGIKFSNNREVRADDFKYSFMRILDPKTRSPNTWIFEKIAGARAFMEGKAEDIYGIKIIDDRTFTIRLERPFAPYLYLLTMPAAYVVPAEEVKNLGPDFSTHPVGTGPFILSAWLPNRELRLVRRHDYFGTKANIMGLIYRIIPEDLTTVAEFELGNLDIITIPASETGRYRGDPRRNKFIEAVAGINTYYLGLNCSRPPFSNSSLRKAVSLAIDRQKLLDTFYEKRGRLASGPVPDILRKWDNPVVDGYDPEKAKALVKQEGLSGSSINLFVTADQEVVDMAEFIQAYLKTVGLNVKIKQLEWSAYKEAVNKGEADMFWLSWWADYPDPENFLFPLFHSANIGPAGNRARYSNPAVDRLIEQGAATLNVKLRALYYEKAERQIVKDAPWVFFWHKTDYLVRQPWLKNYRAYPIYTMDKGTEINLALSQTKWVQPLSLEGRGQGEGD